MVLSSTFTFTSENFSHFTRVTALLSSVAKPLDNCRRHSLNTSRKRACNMVPRFVVDDCCLLVLVVVCDDGSVVDDDFALSSSDSASCLGKKLSSAIIKISAAG